MNSPKISIIIPVYNAAKFLHKCINSILAQTFQDFEILLINDGSTDESGAICDRYTLTDNRIRVFHKENGGVSSARNIGLRNACGEWIYFVDSDDTIYNDCLETLISQTSDDVDCVTGGYTCVYNGKTSGITQVISDRWSYKTALLDFYRPVYFEFNGYLWNRLFRQSIIIDYNIRFHEDIYFKEDGLFLVEFLCNSKKDIPITTKPVYNYHINSDSAMQSLKVYFNKKYLTNLDARILCRKTIIMVINIHDIRLRFEAEKCIIAFYFIVINLMKQHNVDDPSIKIELQQKIRQNVSAFFFILFFLYKVYKKISVKILVAYRKSIKPLLKS